jgi:hypothetical protein
LVIHIDRTLKKFEAIFVWNMGQKNHFKIKTGQLQLQRRDAKLTVIYVKPRVIYGRKLGTSKTLW